MSTCAPSRKPVGRLVMSGIGGLANLQNWLFGIVALGII
jgi:hypothetical protein